jgi:FG-GAP repeat
MNQRGLLVSLTAIAGLAPAPHAQDCVLGQGKLLPQSTSIQQMFGSACAVSGDRCAVLTLQGRVWVYVRTAGVWSLQQDFAANWASGTNQSGSLLALDRDTLAVGDPRRFAPPSRFETGAVDVYVRSGGTWTLQATLTALPPDANAFDHFGSSVALRGDRLLVGAQGDDEAGVDAGAAYSFQRVGVVWTQEAKLTNAGAAGGQDIGIVDFDGRRCIATGGGGRTCIWALHDSRWTQEADLPFGAAWVAIEDRLAALWTVGACTSGAPLLTFARTGSTWARGADVVTSWGGDIALRGGRLVAGYPGNVLCFAPARPARIYSKLEGAWQVDAVAGPSAPSGNGFGRTVAFDGATLLVADPLDDEVASDAGAVWVFAVGPDTACPVDYCTAKVNSQGCTPWMFSDGESSASASSGFRLGVGHVLNNAVGAVFYGLNGRANAPFHGGTLCVASPLHRGPAFASGGSSTGTDCSGVLAFDMNAFAAGALGGNPSPALTLPGTVVDLQWWARDRGFAPPENLQLSAGQEYTVLP